MVGICVGGTVGVTLMGKTVEIIMIVEGLVSVEDGDDTLIGKRGRWKPYVGNNAW